MRRSFILCLIAAVLLAAALLPAGAADPELRPLYSFEAVPPASGGIRAGDTVYFGRYEQDNRAANGKEDIAWTVLEIRDDKALLLSRYILDAIPYHRESASVTWENCTLRQWLNSTFMQTAFTTSEAASILTVTVDNPRNAQYNIRGGNRTTDQVFLLSYDDATSYFWADADRRAYATDYAISRGVYVGEETDCSWWWLRSPGMTEDRAGNVHSSGAASTYGGLVYAGQGGVRPALWVKKSALATTSASASTTTSSITPYGRVRVGSVIRFGSYEQNDIFRDGKEPIEWIVLDVQDGRALLISKYCLDAKPYHEPLTEITWETCYLRDWLNNEFLNTAFSSDEQRKIPTVRIENPSNATYGTYGGNATWDKVFLLSVDEAQRYFPSNVSRRATATIYARNETLLNLDEDTQTESGEDCCWWRLRSPGYQQTHVTRVMTSGWIYEMGDICHYVNGGIRPCIWLDLT